MLWVSSQQVDAGSCRSVFLTAENANREDGHAVGDCKKSPEQGIRSGLLKVDGVPAPAMDEDATVEELFADLYDCEQWL